MMTNIVTTLVSRINSLADSGADVAVEWFGPTSDTDVDAVEKALGLRVPPSLRELLRQTGGGGLQGLEISGIIAGNPLTPNQQTLYGDTTHFRLHYALPDNLLVVQRDADDNEPFCLDASSLATECPVVLYYMSTGRSEPVAADFLAFYEKYLQPYFDEAEKAG
jgi:hypothetical protein